MMALPSVVMWPQDLESGHGSLFSMFVFNNSTCSLLRPHHECEARLIVTEILRRTLRGEADASEQLAHRRLAVVREAEARAHLSIVGKSRAHKPAQRGKQKSVSRPKAQQGSGGGRGTDVRRDHVADQHQTARFQKPTEQREQGLCLLARQILCHRMQHNQIDAMIR
jgi:hypothetical protein